MEQSHSWEANSHSASQEIFLLWTLEVHYHVHKSTLFIHILSQIYPVQTFASYFPKIYSNIIFSSTPRSSK
jgi:hypothetical protein